MNLFTPFSAACAVVITHCAIVPAAFAAVFVTANEANNRFAANQTVTVGSSLTPNASFLINESGISGVGLNQATLITPQHYLTADHAPTATARFRGVDGIVRDYATTGFRQVGATDLRLYTLATPIPSSEVRPMPVFGGPLNYLLGKTVTVFGANRQAGRNVIENIDQASFSNITPNRPTIVAEFIYNTTGPGVLPNEIGLVGGDSGSPMLIDINGQWAVVGTNFGIDTTNPAVYRNFSSIAAAYQTELQSIVAAQGQSIRFITAAAVPEPGSLLVCGVTAAAMIRRRGRSR